MKILLLGDKGFLGQDFKLFNAFFSHWELDIVPKNYRWASIEFKQFILNSNAELILNCISTCEYTNEAFLREIHYELPLWLSDNSNKKLINFSSDVAYQLATNKKVNKKYELYAKCKLSAEEALSTKNNTLIIRTSIIGLSKSPNNLINKLFMSNHSPIIYGYDNVFWNGITSLQLYKEISNLISEDSAHGNLQTLSSDCMSMFSLLNLINDIFCFNKIIKKQENAFLDNRCMPKSYELPLLNEQLKQLYDFYSLNFLL